MLIKTASYVLRHEVSSVVSTKKNTMCLYHSIGGCYSNERN